jgi:hypothetical protein
MPDDKSQGIVRTGRSEEQSADKERAQNAIKTEPGHMPAQPVIKKSEVKSATSQTIAEEPTIRSLKMAATAAARQGHNDSSPEGTVGADVRPEPPPGTEPILPERLVRPATGPLNPRTGRKPTE